MIYAFCSWDLLNYIIRIVNIITLIIGVIITTKGCLSTVLLLRIHAGWYIYSDEHDYWIGSYKTRTNVWGSCEFIWLDGTSWDYKKWALGEPDCNHNDSFCVNLQHSSYEMADKSCSEEHHYICKASPLSKFSF